LALFVRRSHLSKLSEVGKDVEPANYAHQHSVYEQISLTWCSLTCLRNQKASVLQENSRHLRVARRTATLNQVVSEV